VTELKSAIKKILKRTISEDEAQEIVQLIDRDNDGKVSVRELFQYVETKKEKEEVEALEVCIRLFTYEYT
jgi:Ca2+-binding EF-hand superfamily protein